MGLVAKPYMRNGFLTYEEMRKYLVIYEEAVSQICIWLCSRSRLNFFIHEEDLFFLFISVVKHANSFTTAACSLLGSLLRDLYQRVLSFFYRGPGSLVVVWFGSSPTPSPPLSHQKARWERGCGGRHQIIRQRESQVLYNSCNTLCFVLTRISKGVTVTACFAVEPSSLSTAACS